jgi:uncharacterized protein YhaN
VRIRELHLKAFGPFTDTRLAFPDLEGGTGPGLCVIYGPNEAGKTSALRAIHNLLYGIPAQSSDKFLHDYGRMRVGAQIVFSDGESFEFLRRKGVRDTLLSVSSDGGGEAPTSHPRLEALVRAVPANVFENFYGLDHARLSRGSRDLLETDGELGQALFSAGLGSGNLRAVIDDLSNEAEALFKVRGSTPRLNAALRDFEDTKKGIRASALKPAAWKEAATAAEAVHSQLTRVEAELEEVQAERTRLDRIRRTLPALGRMRHALTEFESRAATRALAEDFEERLRAARALEASAEESRLRATDLARRRAEQLEALELGPSLIESRESIEALGEGIGAYQGEVDQLPRREAELERHNESIRSILESMGPEGGVEDSASARAATLSSFSAAMAQSGRIRELADDVIESQTKLESLVEALERAESIHTARKDEIREATEPAVPTELRRALERARRLGEVDDRLARCGPEIEAREDHCARRLASLGRWDGPLSDIDQVAFPDLSTVEDFGLRADKLHRRTERLDERGRELESARVEAEEQLSRLRAEASVPSEAERDRLRVARDTIWRDIRRHFVDGPSPSPSPPSAPSTSPDSAPRSTPDEASLPTSWADQFESERDAADRIADRLHAEAGRVAEHAQLVSKLERLTTQQTMLAREQGELDAQTGRWRTEWESLWADVGVSPSTPSEMRAWLDEIRRVREAFVDLRQERLDWKTRLHERDVARDGIAAALDRVDRDAIDRDAIDRDGKEWDAPESDALGRPVFREPHRARDGSRRVGNVGRRLDDEVARGEAVLVEIESERARIARLRETLEASAVELDQATRAHRRAHETRLEVGRALAGCVAGLGLGDSPAPREVQGRLELLSRLFEEVREHEKLAERVDKMRSNAERFAAAVSDVVSRCALDLVGASPDVAVVRLRERLAHAAEQETKRAGLADSLEEVRCEIESATRSLANVEAEFERLRVEADVASDADLDAALAASKSFVASRRALEDREAQLAEVGEGRSMSQLETEVKDVDTDTLPGRIEQLDHALEELRVGQKKAYMELSERRSALAQMDGSETVAGLAETSQALLATIDVDVRRYAKLVLAREILTREVDRYRQGHQAPVLDRTSELFRELTLGAYQGVRSEYDADDRPQLVAVGANEEKKEVTALSSGARDQLFLALRLATLEQTFVRGEPMPLIADDILVEFDAARSRATLEVLADLGRKTQILLFSHHAHIADQARELGTRAHVLEL